jgi:hypothetical protein
MDRPHSGARSAVGPITVDARVLGVARPGTDARPAGGRGRATVDGRGRLHQSSHRAQCLPRIRSGVQSGRARRVRHEPIVAGLRGRAGRHRNSSRIHRRLRRNRVDRRGPGPRTRRGVAPRRAAPQAVRKRPRRARRAQRAAARSNSCPAALGRHDFRGSSSRVGLRVVGPRDGPELGVVGRFVRCTGTRDRESERPAREFGARGRRGDVDRDRTADSPGVCRLQRRVLRAFRRGCPEP